MKVEHIEILHLDILYRIDRNLQRDIKEILMNSYRTGFSDEIPDDLELLEFYEILKFCIWIFFTE